MNRVFYRTNRLGDEEYYCCYGVAILPDGSHVAQYHYVLFKAYGEVEIKYKAQMKIPEFEKATLWTSQNNGIDFNHVLKRAAEMITP